MQRSATVHGDAHGADRLAQRHFLIDKPVCSAKWLPYNHHMPTRTENIGPCECCFSDLGPCSPLCDGGAARSIGSLSPPMSPGCSFVVGNDFYDLVNGSSGVTPGGIAVSISGASDFRQLGGTPGSGIWSADMGDAGEWIVVTASGGPITITCTAPAGKKICYAEFGATNNSFGTNNTWAATVNDTGGNNSVTGQSVTTSAFSGSCALTNGGFFAQAAPGESITSMVVSSTADYTGIGGIAFCLVDA